MTLDIAYVQGQRKPSHKIEQPGPLGDCATTRSSQNLFHPARYSQTGQVHTFCLGFNAVRSQRMRIHRFDCSCCPTAVDSMYSTLVLPGPTITC